MKKLTKTIKWLLGIFLGLYLTLIALVNLDITQKWLAGVGESYLSKKLNTEVKIEKISVDLLNRVVLQDVCLKDQAGENLLKAKSVSAKIELRSLFKEQLSLRTISLLDADVHLYQATSESDPSFQFVLNAFKSDSKEKKPVNLRINSLVLHRVNLTYDKLFEQHNTERIDLNHLNIQNLSGNASIKVLRPDTINARLRELSFSEQSGLNVQHFSAKFALNKQTAQISDIILQLPNSHFKQKSLSVAFTDNNHGKRWSSLQSSETIDDVKLYLPDFSFLNSKLKDWEETLLLNTTYSLQNNNLHANLNISSPQDNLTFQSQNTASWNEEGLQQVDTKINQLYLNKNFINLIPESILKSSLKTTLSNLATINVTGKGTYSKSAHSTFDFNTQTDLGNINTVGQFKNNIVTARINAKDVNLKQILQQNHLPSNIFINSDLNLALQDGSLNMLKGTTEFPLIAFDKFTLHNVNLQSEIANGKNSKVYFNINDSYAKVNGTLSGLFNGKTISNLESQLQIDKIVPSAMGIGGILQDKSFSGNANIRLKNMSLENPDADIQLSNITITTTDDTHHIDNLDLHLSSEQSSVNCDFADIVLQGNPSLKEIIAVGKNLVHQALPGLVAAKSLNSNNNQAWTLRGQLRPTSIYKALFNKTINFTEPINFAAHLEANQPNSSLSISAPDIQYDSIKFKDLRLYAENRPEHLKLIAQGDQQIAGQNINWEIETKAVNKQLETSLSWKGDNSNIILGQLSSIAKFKNQGKDIEINIIPSDFYIGNQQWHASKSLLHFTDGNINITDFSLSNEDQWLKIDGNLSKSENDTIFADLHNINLEYVMGLVNFDAVDFAGPVSGKAYFMHDHNDNIIRADISMSPLMLNNAEMGRLELVGGFDFANKQINLNGNIYNTDTLHLNALTHVEGFVNLNRKDINLDINSQHTNVAFIQKFVKDIFSDFRGTASGHCRLFGPLKQLDLEGSERIDAHINIPTLGTGFDATDGFIDFSEGRIGLRDIIVNDGKNGSGIVNGVLKHQHLKHIEYDIVANMNNMLVFNQPERPDWTFYATAFGTGQAHLIGYPGSFEADIDLVTEPGTNFVYMMSAPGDMSVAPFIQFGDKKQKTASADSVSVQSAPVVANSYYDRSDIRLNMNIEANENAGMNVIMDEKTGDAISTRGLGSIRASFYNKGDFQMYGTYTLSEGNYRMQIQNIIRKDFRFKEGSKINFSGNPKQGTLDMQAVYTVNSASLRDLNIGNEFSTSTTKVNCLLNLQGQVEEPQVTFDIEFPNVNDDEASLFRSVISTQEDLQMQVAYLLAVGRFYAQDASQMATTYKESQASAATKSLLSNMLSGQLNNALQNIIGVSNWTIGTNLATGSLGSRSMEADALISGRLFNNRLLIDGNIGYRDNIYNTSNFVGDFDVQYLLTPRGEIRLKAYSKTNDRYFTKSSLTTQGLGISFNRSFTHFKDIFRRNKKVNKRKDKK